MTASTKKLWRFDPDALRPGDVVLEAGASAQGRVIRAIESGRYSHALFWLGDGDFIEAVGIGARIISFKRVIVEDRADWAVLRLADDGVVGQTAAKEARNLAHLRYDLRGALGTKIGFLRREDRTRLFCSQLVAQAYQKAGFALVDGQQPNAITPKMLHTSSKLAVITPDFEELGAYDVPATDRDDAYAGSLAYVDLLISQEAVAAASKYLPNGLTAPGNLVQLYEHLGALNPDLCSAISDALIDVFNRTGYFQLLEDEEAGVRQWLEGELAALGDMPPDNRRLMGVEFSVLAEGYQSAAERHDDLAARFSSAFSRTRIPIWKCLADCHARRGKLFGRLKELAARGKYAANE